MKKRWSIWDIIAWIVLFLILVWILLKTFGIIHTPLWLEYAPLYGAVYLAGWQIHKLDSVASDVRELKRFKDATVNEINKLKSDCFKNHYKKR
jgi:hypothetical protein